MKGGYPSDNENVREGMNSTVAVFLRNKELFNGQKKLIFEKTEENEPDLLSESNIRDLDN